MNYSAEHRDMVLRAIRAIPESEPVCASDLCSDLNIHNVVFRAICSELTKEGYPIGSCRSGFYWAESVSAKETKLRHLLSRRRHLQHHIVAIINQIRTQRRKKEGEQIGLNV